MHIMDTLEHHEDTQKMGNCVRFFLILWGLAAILDALHRLAGFILTTAEVSTDVIILTTLAQGEALSRG
jgi:hypothetical protein